MQHSTLGYQEIQQVLFCVNEKYRCAHKMAVAEGFSLQVLLIAQTDREAATLEPSGSCIQALWEGSREEWPNGEHLSVLPATADVTLLEEQWSSSRCVDDQNSHQSPQKAVFLSPQPWGAASSPLFLCQMPSSVLCRGRKWPVRGREQESEEMSYGDRWKLSPVAAAPWAPWAIHGQVGLEWKQELCWELHRERGTIGFPPVPSTKLQMDQSLRYPVSGGKSCELKLTEQMSSNSHCH